MTIPYRGKDLRKGRYSESGRIYLITTVTHNRTPWFRDLGLGRIVVRSLIRQQMEVDTLAYVVMPDHLHWLMQLHEEVQLSMVVQRIKSVSSHRVNGILNKNDPVWQAGFHDHALRKEEDIKSVARYVIANPVRAGLVKSVKDYSLWDVKWL